MTATQTAVTATERPRLTRRQMILAALAAFIRSRPGLEFANYGDVTSYRAEQRSIARDKREAELLWRAVKSEAGITADDLIRAARSAFSGRLSIVGKVETGYGRVRGKWRDAVDGEEPTSYAIEYCTGQYYPTEYRKAACAVLASALWDQARTEIAVDRASDHPSTQYRDKSPGDAIRRYLRREFGATMQRRWFD